MVCNPREELVGVLASRLEISKNITLDQAFERLNKQYPADRDGWPWQRAAYTFESDTGRSNWKAAVSQFIEWHNRKKNSIAVISTYGLDAACLLSTPVDHELFQEMDVVSGDWYIGPGNWDWSWVIEIKDIGSIYFVSMGDKNTE